ncbi:hypothetical protein DSM21852_37930 [Methylocystis bryophila]|nr:hypothetical protein DSM21852_37930 [Methylocystis bryophila]
MAGERVDILHNPGLRMGKESEGLETDWAGAGAEMARAPISATIRRNPNSRLIGVPMTLLLTIERDAKKWKPVLRTNRALSF